MMTVSTYAIPAQHTGVYYIELMKTLSQKRRVKKYLEIGVEKGLLLSAVHADEAYGIDPSFDLCTNVCANKKSLQLFQCTSDEAFADEAITVKLRGADLVFLDGYHTFEFLLRDFANVEKLSHSRTLIGLHDSLPLDEIMVTRTLDDWMPKTQGTKYQGWWTGDVWKTVAILKKYRPDLGIVCVDCPPTGIVFITNLDPANRRIDDDYLAIVQEFARVDNDIHALTQYYQGIDMVSAAAVVNENDHSLYFKT